MKTCSINGEIVDVSKGTVFIKAEPASECVSCGAKMLCGSGKSKLYKIKTDEAFNVGDKIQLHVSAKAAYASSFLLYALGVAFAITISAIAIHFLKFSEVTTAFIFMLFIILWIIFASTLIGNYVKHKIKIIKS